MTATTGSLRQAAIRGATWSFAETWGVRLFGLGVFVLLGRLLDPADFGTVAVAALFVDLVGLFVGTGLSTYLVQATDIDETETSTAFWTSLFSAAVLGSAVFLAAPLVAPLFDRPELVPMVRWLAVGMFLTGLIQVPTGLLQRGLRFRQLAMRSITATFVSGVAAVALAFAGAGAWSLVVQTIVFAAVRTASVWVGARWLPSFRFSLRTARRMIAYSLNVIGLTLVQFGRSRGEEFLIGTVMGPSTLGVWVVAKRLVRVVIEMFSGVVARVATPIFARTKSDPARLTRGYTTSIFFSSALLSPVLCLLAAGSPVGIPLLFGDQWQASGQIAGLLSLGFVLHTASYLDTGLLLAVNRARLAFGLTAIGAATHLCVALGVLWADGSMVVLASALAIRNALYWPVRLATIRRVIDFDVWRLVRDLCRVWSAAGVAGAVTWVVLWAAPSGWSTWVDVVVAGLCGLLSYPSALWITNRPVLKEVLSILRAAVRR